MNSFSAMAKYLTENAEQLAIKIVNAILKRMNVEFPEKEKQYYFEIYIEFIKVLAEVIKRNEMIIPQAFVEMSKSNGERQAALRGKISSIISRYPHIRLGFIEQITKISVEHGLSPHDTVEVNKRVNYMLDVSVIETILAFERQQVSVIDEREKEIIQKQRAINELSAPIVPIQDGIAVLPLIGAVDDERVQHISNKVLPQVSHMEIECLIIDFSGIETIDTDVASHLFKIYEVLRLLGINVVFTGIRPDLATKAIKAGIDFSSIKTFSNVKQAIASIH